MQTPDVSNAARPPPLREDYPTANMEYPERASGQAKIKIHHTNIDGILPPWLEPPGVLRAMLDLVLADDGGHTSSLSHPSEKTLYERQVRVEGYQIITSVRTESTLDKIAATLLRGFAHSLCADALNDDEVLTRFGFRAPRVEDKKINFIERLIALQLIIRRCLELHEVSGGEPLPLFGFRNPTDYNKADWDRLLSDSESPGTASPQKKTTTQQIAEVEATFDSAASATQATANTAMLEQVAQTIARLEDANKRLRDDLDEFRRAAKRPRTETGKQTSPAPHPSCTPATLPATPPTTATDTEKLRVTRILTELPEIDPATSVNRMVVAEVATKFKAHQRITAEYVYSVTCTADQTKKLNFTSDGAGGIQMDQVETSTRKIKSHYHIEQVTKSVIDTLSSMAEHRDAAFKLQQSFPITTARAHAKYQNDVTLTTAYWNRHFNAWATGLLVSGENFSLRFSQDFWDDVKDEARIAADTSRDADNKNKALKDLQRQLRNLTREKNGRSDANDTSGKPPAAAPGQRGPLTLSDDQITADMRTSFCVNFKAGRRCMVRDSHGKCVFSHDGITFGEDPGAARKRWADQQAK